MIYCERILKLFIFSLPTVLDMNMLTTKVPINFQNPIPKKSGKPTYLESLSKILISVQPLLNFENKNQNRLSKYVSVQKP